MELAPETIRAIVEGNAQTMFEQQSMASNSPEADGVAEKGGGMVPIVVVESEQRDRRRDKRLERREMKLALVHEHGSTQLHCGVTPLGGVEGAGRALFDSACRAGFGAACRSMQWATAPPGSAIRSSSALARKRAIESLTDAVHRVEAGIHAIAPQAGRDSAVAFGADRFRAEMRDLVSRGLKDGFSSLLPREHART